MTASEYFEQGRKMLDEGNLMLAMEFFQAAIEVDKHFEKAYMLLSEVYKRQGKDEKAKSTMFSLLAVDPTNTRALTSLKELLNEPSNQKQDSQGTDMTIHQLSGFQSISKGWANYKVAYKGVEFDMLFVKGGRFSFGAQRENVFKPNYDPQALFRENVLDKSVGDFYIGKYLVTQKQWVEVMGSNPSSYQMGGNYPVENVSSSEISVFINRLNNDTNCSFRLLTDVEWEYAARGGNLSKGYKYPGSNILRDVAWTSYDSIHTGEVGRKKPNELGIHDMLGNVCELCRGDTFFSRVSSQLGPGLVIRGGSDKLMWDWYNYRRGHGGKLERINLCRISAWTSAPLNADEDIGFRLAMDI